MKLSEYAASISRLVEKYGDIEAYVGIYGDFYEANPANEELAIYYIDPDDAQNFVYEDEASEEQKKNFKKIIAIFEA